MPCLLPSHSPRRVLRAFTLVELLVVIAVIGVLGAVALPAYNNYSLKSKFSEVVLATAPTKTAISACAVSGDCVSGSAVSLAASAASGSSGGGSSYVVSNTAPMSQALLYAAIFATYSDFGSTNPAGQAQNFATNGTAYYLISAASVGRPNDVCVSTASSAAANACTYVATTPAHVQAVLNGATDPYFTTAASAPASLGSLPCVGGSGCSPATKYVSSVSYDAAGVITATAQASSGLKGETFVLSPSYSSGRIDWSASGTCKTRAGGALC